MEDNREDLDATTDATSTSNESIKDYYINVVVLGAILLSSLFWLCSIKDDHQISWPVHIVQDNWKSYLTLLSLHPIFTKAMTSAIVYFLGDLISQLVTIMHMG
jgi:hypothetical protein